MSFLKKNIIIVLCGQSLTLLSQPEISGCAWTQFEHANGMVASEGCFVDGRPAGVWLNYSEEGILVSKGERLNDKPHGEWIFFEQGKLSEKVEFDDGKRNGIQTLWKNGQVTDSVRWNNGKREGWMVSYRSDGSLRQQTLFQADQKEGKSLIYNEQNQINGYRWYKNNRLIASENFNRIDDQGRKTGPWKMFHSSGRLIETGFYVDDLKDGVFQFFDANGRVVDVKEFRKGKEVIDSKKEEPVVQVVEIRNEQGRLEQTVTYVDGMKQGVSRAYDAQGEITSGSVFDQDVLVAEGITLEDGTRHGDWIQYWPNGNVKCTGEYTDGLEIGTWTYFRETGQKEQEGVFLDGALHSLWTWWYPDGKIHRQERYKRGALHGEFLELDTSGEAIVSGAYEGGEAMGSWVIHINDHKEVGEFVLGQKDGLWQHWYGDGKRQYEGEFSFGQPTGKHKSWHPNGVLEEVGSYESGAKHKKWRLYDEFGSLIHEYIYKYGKLRKVDGVKVDKRRDGKIKD